MAQDAFARAAETSDLRTLLGSARRPLLLGVAGDSGSGKTTYTHGIRRLLGNDLVTSIPLDGYHREDRAQRRRSGRLPLDPANNHLDLIEEHLRALRGGRPVEVPVYNHQTGCFDAPQIVRPTPVVIIEGLHALYEHLCPLLDFALYVDTDRDVKWRWKFERDVSFRGHDPAELEEEIQRREAAYKQWIDFQKTSADVVVKIHESQLGRLAHQKYDGAVPDNCYHLEIVLTPGHLPLPALNLPVNLNAVMNADSQPFMLAAVPSSYWGKRVNVTHIDGVIPLEAMQHLEQEIMAVTGIAEDLETCLVSDEAQNSTMRFAQSLVAWPFLGMVGSRLQEWRAEDHR
ncbi:phosphoribulokinase [Aquisalimonas lutea]|uniref:phosphoribulokinase n=1 Tax=Aquisalimonas lutea TaxID=1327750 RepID=UPI0025B4FAC5|nr:phosphoribulokinase [Aquisalimonas lutea]MDN3519212.1 phosphoribulokinase [Aquisalimonas lutea]